MRNIRRISPQHKMPELHLVRERLQNKLGSNFSFYFEIAEGVEGKKTAAEAIVDGKILSGEIRDSSPENIARAIADELDSIALWHRYPKIIRIRGGKSLLYFPDGTPPDRKAREVASVAFESFASRKRIFLADSVKEGLAYSFQGEFLSETERNKLFNTRFSNPIVISGLNLSKEIWNFAPPNSQLRAKMRLEILQKEFKNVPEAIDFLREHFSK